jgi:outer membrane protein insertion porin family
MNPNSASGDRPIPSAETYTINAVSSPEKFQANALSSVTLDSTHVESVNQGSLLTDDTLADAQTSTAIDTDISVKQDADESPDDGDGQEFPDGTDPEDPEADIDLEEPEVELDEEPGPEEQPAPPTPIPQPSQPGSEQAEPEPRVLIAEVAVVGVEEQPELETIVYDAIQTRPGRTTTRSQLQEDINSIFATGFFSNVRAVPEDTPLGVRVTFEVDPNPVLQQVQISGSALQEQGETLNFEGEQLTVQQIANEIFEPQYGQTLNLREFQVGIERLNEVYQENGYVLAQVIDAPQVSPDGTVTLDVTEGVIEDIQVRFLDDDGQPVDEEGNPIEGRTRDFIITREFESEPGDVFNQQQIQQDLERVFALGIFDDVRISLDPGEDPRQVDVVVNVIEGRTGSLAAGIGFSSSSGIFGSVSYQQQNLGGNNQRLGAEVQVGERELLFDVRFTDPWIAGDPYRTSYTVNAFSRRSISLIFDGGEDDVDLDNGDSPRVNRLGGAVSFSRPLDEWLGWEGWRGSAGFQYQRVRVTDSDGDLAPEDEEGNELSFSGSGRDDLFTLQLGLVRDRRNSATQPTSGSVLRLGSEQSLPLGAGSILFNRVRASYSRYFPVSITNFTDGPEALAFNVQAGTIVGDLPPYEAFSLGGTDSVRGYEAGDLGSGRSFLQATAEYRFPIFSIVGGALFFDFGTDLGTADDVPGEPANVRDKPGTGFGYGLGVRIQSPLGPIRVDYGINDEGDSQIHFGVGERF